MIYYLNCPNCGAACFVQGTGDEYIGWTCPVCKTNPTASLPVDGVTGELVTNPDDASSVIGESAPENVNVVAAYKPGSEADPTVPPPESEEQIAQDEQLNG